MHSEARCLAKPCLPSKPHSSGFSEQSGLTRAMPFLLLRNDANAGQALLAQVIRSNTLPPQQHILGHTVRCESKTKVSEKRMPSTTESGSALATCVAGQACRAQTAGVKMLSVNHAGQHPLHLICVCVLSCANMHATHCPQSCLALLS